MVECNQYSSYLNLLERCVPIFVYQNECEDYTSSKTHMRPSSCSVIEETQTIKWNNNMEYFTCVQFNMN